MSSVIEFKCPHCAHEIRTSARYAGMQGKCPHCGKAVKVEAPAGVDLMVLTPPPSTKGATDANPIWSGLAGAAATIVLYALFLAISQTYIGQLFTNRGPVQYLSTFVVCWGLAMLALKYWAVKQQMSYVGRELELIPLESGVQITPANVETFLRHLDSLPPHVRDSILGKRIRGGLEHFRARANVPEVQAYLASQASIDASGVDSGYTLLRCFIWVIPILGFIGTVTGISAAVTGLSDSLKSATPAQTSSVDPAGEAGAAGVAEGDSAGVGSLMMKGMGLVTQGLATAFDTTFVGLVFAAVLLFPTESLKRIEYVMLDRVEAFTNDSLLRRLSDDSPGAESLSPEVARVLESAFRKHQQWLLEWQTKVSELGGTIGREFEKHVVAAQSRIESLQGNRATETLELLKSFVDVLSATDTSISQLRDAGATIAADLQATVTASAELQQVLGQNTSMLADVAAQWRNVRPPPEQFGAEQLETAIAALTRAVDRLNQPVAQANAAPLAPADSAPRRKRWFGS